MFTFFSFATSNALSQSPGGSELFRFQSPSGADYSVEIIVNREGQVATGVSLDSNNRDDFMLFYQPGGNVTTSVVPNSGRLSSFSFSNAGAAATVIESGLPWKVYASSFGGALQQIFVGTENGTNSTPAITDSGVVYFAARPDNSTAFNQVWMWTNGGTSDLLPVTGGYSVGDTLFVDSSNRVYVTNDVTNPSTVVDLYRYSPALGTWQNLTSSLNSSQNVALLAAETAKAINAQGDMLFPIDESNSYSLNFYSQLSGSITKITDFNKPWLFGFNLPRRIEVGLADTGEIFTVIGGADSLDPTASLLYYLADGTTIDLTNLLPSGFSFGTYPQYPFLWMSHEGKLLISAVDDLTGRWSYFYYDQTRDLFRSITELQQLQLPVMQAAISDDGHIYYWYDEGSETVLRSVAVPETDSFIAVGLFVFCCWAGYATNRLCRSLARAPLDNDSALFNARQS